MGRTREFSEDDAVAAATNVFWRLGFEATSLPKLLDAMGLSKSSFYHSFDSKEALFERCLLTYGDRLVHGLRDALATSPSGEAFLRDVLFGVADDAVDAESRRGCLVMNTANEFGQRAPALAKVVGRQIARFEDVFASALERVARENASVGAADIRRLARYFVCSLSGLKTMAKAGATRSTLRETAELMLHVLS